MADLTQTLVAASQADRQAEQVLEEWLQSNFVGLVQALAQEVATDGKPLAARQMASLYLKNTLAAKSTALLREKQARWKALDKAARQPVKDGLLQSMRSNEAGVAHFGAVAAAEIAAVELPHNEWPEFVPALLEHVTQAQYSQQSEAVPLASFECLGYTCERIAEVEDLLPDVPELAAETVDKMLTTIVDGVQPSRSNELRFKALQALKNSLGFCRKNMQIKSERDVIFQAICEATRSTDARVRALAFQCMEEIAEYYYEQLPDYMTAIFQLTTQAIKSELAAASSGDESVPMAAIQFWSALAYVEQTLLDEEMALAAEGIQLEQRPPCPQYVKAAMEQLVPLLLETLTKQEEDVEDSDIWNLQAAGAVCLELISQTVEGAIVPVVIPFVQQHIRNENWRYRDAAIVAFASILDGPSTDLIGKYVAEAIPVLLAAFNDPHVVVRDSATHAISKICRLHMEAIPADQFSNVVQGLMGKLSENPRVASHACSAIYNMALSLKKQAGGGVPETNVLSSHMLPLISALLTTCDRDVASESANLRVSSMAAVAELILAAAADVQPIFRDLLPAIVQRLEAALQIQVISSDDQENKEQLLGLQCGLLQPLFQRLTKNDVMPHVDRIMELLLQVLQVRNASCHEEALLTIGAVASSLEQDFMKYMQAFMPFLLSSLKSFQAQSLCTVAVGVVVDMCGAMGSMIQPQCDQIMGVLTECLRDSSVNREVKPIVISCLGDIAMAIGGAYQPYLEISTMLLMQAAQQKPPADDEDLVAFINSLRLSVLEAYTGIIFGLSDGNMLSLFVPNVPSILQFLEYLASAESRKDEEVLQKAVALIGDLAQQMGTDQSVRQQIQTPYVGQLIQQAGTSSDESTREIAGWTRGVVEQMVAAK